MAKNVNLGDKYTHRLTLRLTEEQFNFVLSCSSLLDVSPSEYLRMSIHSYMVLAEKLKNNTEGLVGTNNENVKTDSNNQL